MILGADGKRPAHWMAVTAIRLANGTHLITSHALQPGSAPVRIPGQPVLLVTAGLFAAAARQAHKVGAHRVTVRVT